MAHPKHDPRSIASTEADIRSILMRATNPDDAARILTRRVTVAQASGSPASITGLYQAALETASQARRAA